MKRRFVGTVLMGLGALFLVLAVGLRFFVAPAVTRLPYDMQQCPAPEEPQPDGCLKPSVAEAKGATFLQIEGGKLAIRQGTLQSTTWVRPQPKATADWQSIGEANRLGDNAVIWNVSSEARWVDGGDAVISAYSTELALDRVTGAALPWDAQWLDDANLGTAVPKHNVDYKGQVYKFPFGTEKKDYEIYDTNIQQALPARFVDVASVGNLEAYHFKQEIPRQPAVNVSPASLAALRSTYGLDGHQCQGHVQQRPRGMGGPGHGRLPRRTGAASTRNSCPTMARTVRRRCWGGFKYTAETVTNAVKSAENNHFQLSLVHLWGPIGVGIVGLLLILGGALLAFRRGRQEPVYETGAWDESLPEPRHRLRGDVGYDETVAR